MGHKDINLMEDQDRKKQPEKNIIIEEKKERFMDKEGSKAQEEIITLSEEKTFNEMKAQEENNSKADPMESKEISKEMIETEEKKAKEKRVPEGKKGKEENKVLESDNTLEGKQEKKIAEEKKEKKGKG